MQVVRELWQEELVNSIRTVEDLGRFVALDAATQERLQEVLKTMRLSITPHSARLIDWSNPRDPLYLTAVPAAEELVVRAEEHEDPIGDVVHEKIPFMTHRYPNRVLVYATFACSQYCRFCFRRFRTGVATVPPSPADMEKIREYLVAHPEIDEVILSGGDPLTLTDELLERWFVLLRSVSSVIRIRIHTRVPVNMPSRITPEFVALVKKYQDATHPVIVVTHFNHPREIASGNIDALARLIDAGIVVRNQSVLLRGVNDSVETLALLFTTLTNIRVQPYYLHQLDLARGTNHFRVPLEEGVALMEQLQGRLTGIALPRYMLDIPGGKGKVSVSPQFVVANGQGGYRITTWQGEVVDYQEPK